ncbi:glycosyltransferase [Haliscomenobacter hydrossis]|uniref:Glycosyl transferase family 2 n=1 Tax=Haliscomenobacter hydrossis (strain ATCC 27775 / DSM 1100 / LMG 10767 / O) TaxID=760192 RepID=F4KXV6_HALH1|nr:glycosyltransferase [Haliscomenobacter hydrossis]AEE52615.1 glycosyl transferase family 2 [Haliscomenobacter hydrossis DSM 1100]
MNTEHHPKLLSLLIPAFNSATRLRTAYEAIRNCLEAEQIPFEMLIIDDGSIDNTWELMKTLAAEDSRVRPFRMSRNYTSPYVQFAGMSVCRGACISFMPDDLQRPLETLVESYRLWEKGHKLVISYRSSRNDGWLNDLFSNFYYRIMNTLSEVTFPPGGADGYLADREIIDIMNTRIHPIHTSSVVEVLRLGFDPIFVPYDRPSRPGKSRWTWKKKVRLAKDTFFASSSFPIRAITYLGLGISLLCLLAIPLLVYARFFAESRLFGFEVPGWTTIITLVAFFNGLVLFCLGIVAEYIWRIYEEVKGRPGFLLRKDDLMNDE